MTTAQQLADYWAWQVEIGRGQWEARLCMRGLLGLPEPMPANTHIGMTIPQPIEMYDEARRIVFGSARIMETKE